MPSRPLDEQPLHNVRRPIGSEFLCFPGKFLIYPVEAKAQKVLTTIELVLTVGMYKIDATRFTH